jgi:hypothetical protein
VLGGGLFFFVDQTPIEESFLVLHLLAGGRHATAGSPGKCLLSGQPGCVRPDRLLGKGELGLGRLLSCADLLNEQLGRLLIQSQQHRPRGHRLPLAHTHGHDPARADGSEFEQAALPKKTDSGLTCFAP